MKEIMNVNDNVEVIPEEDVEVINPQDTHQQSIQSIFGFGNFFTTDDFFNQDRTRNLLNDEEFHRQNIFGFNNFSSNDNFFNEYERRKNEIHQASIEIDQRMREFDKLIEKQRDYITREQQIIKEKIEK